MTPTADISPIMMSGIRAAGTGCLVGVAGEVDSFLEPAFQETSARGSVFHTQSVCELLVV